MGAPFHKLVVCPILIDRVNELTALYTLIDQANSGSGQVDGGYAVAERLLQE